MLSTLTHVPSCAHFMSASVHRWPSVFFFFSSGPSRENTALGSRLPSSIYTTWPLACSLYGPASLSLSLSLCPGLSSSGPSAASVVPGGIRDDTSPISPRRECPRRRFVLVRRSHRHASLNLARFIVRARRLTASRTVRLLYGLCLRS